jgi:RimJ/RimL family protein N-acetyltransferase
MDRQPILEGERLVLRPLEPGDRDALSSVASDRLLLEQHPAHDRWRPEVFGKFFDEALREGGALAVILKNGERIVGSSQFRACPIAPEEMEIGWTFLARDQWGGGTNREMKRLMLAHALESVPRVLFRIGDTNWRSSKAMEKIGGVLTDLEEHGAYLGKPIKHVVYEITREAFLAGPLSQSVKA